MITALAILPAASREQLPSHAGPVLAQAFCGLDFHPVTRL